MSTTPANATNSPDIQNTRWRIDPQRSSIEFHVRHLWGLQTVKGRFERYDGTLDLAADPAIELAIDADSLNTNQTRRDEHLRSAAFFDTPNNPQVRFVSRRAFWSTTLSSRFRIVACRITITLRQATMPR